MVVQALRPGRDDLDLAARALERHLRPGAVVLLVGLEEFAVQVHGCPDRVGPGGQTRDVDPLVGELRRIQVAPSDGDPIRRAERAALAAARLVVLAELGGARQAGVSAVRVEEAEADLRVATGAVRRPEVVREHPPDVPVVVAVARVAQRRSGVDPALGAAGPIDHLVDDPRLLRRRPPATDLERTLADVEHLPTEPQEAAAAGRSLDAEARHLRDLQVRQLVRCGEGGGGRKDPKKDAQGAYKDDQTETGSVASSRRHPLDGTRPERAASGRGRVVLAIRRPAQVLRSSDLPPPLVLRQRPFAEPDRLRGDLDELVAGDELERGFERERPRRRQAERLVVAVRSDVRELLLLGRVDVHVARPAVLADDHPLVDLDARADEQLRPLFEVEEAVGVRRAGAVAHEHTVRPVGDLTGPRAVALADLVQEGGAAGLGQQLAAVADQAPDRQHELHAHAAVRVGRHLVQATLAAGHRALDLPDVLRRDVDGDPLVRLVDLTADLAQQHLRTRCGQLESLATHLLDQDGQLELAAPADLEGLAGFGRPDLDRHVAEHLLLEAGHDLAARHVLALASGERRRVHAERHAQRRSVDVEARQRARVARLGQRVADRDLGQSCDADDVAGARLLDVDALDAVRGLQARHGAADRHRPAGLDRTGRVVGLLAHDGDALSRSGWSRSRSARPPSVPRTRWPRGSSRAAGAGARACRSAPA